MAHVVAEVQKQALRNKFRLDDYFRDFDQLNHKYINKNRFERALSIAKVQLTRKQLDDLEEMFDAGDGNVDYATFCDQVNEVYSVKGLELSPTKQVRLALAGTNPRPYGLVLTDDEASSAARHHAQRDERLSVIAASSSRTSSGTLTRTTPASSAKAVSTARCKQRCQRTSPSRKARYWRRSTPMARPCAKQSFLSRRREHTKLSATQSPPQRRPSATQAQSCSRATTVRLGYCRRAGGKTMATLYCSVLSELFLNARFGCACSSMTLIRCAKVLLSDQSSRRACTCASQASLPRLKWIAWRTSTPSRAQMISLTTVRCARSLILHLRPKI